MDFNGRSFIASLLSIIVTVFFGNLVNLILKLEGLKYNVLLILCGVICAVGMIFIQEHLFPRKAYVGEFEEVSAKYKVNNL
jgi:UDP-N-acetylmuramyl pentapeptide phosphotransferase/UDP-N-acetylglucosamine-1-phosphate transferase